MASGKLCYYWCVTDFEPRFILVSVGVSHNDGHLRRHAISQPDDVYVVNVGSAEAAQDLWEQYHDRLHFEPSPWPAINRILQQQHRRRREALGRERRDCEYVTPVVRECDEPGDGRAVRAGCVD